MSRLQSLSRLVVATLAVLLAWGAAPVAVAQPADAGPPDTALRESTVPLRAEAPAATPDEEVDAGTEAAETDGAASPSSAPSDTADESTAADEPMAADESTETPTELDTTGEPGEGQSDEPAELEVHDHAASAEEPAGELVAVSEPVRAGDAVLLGARWTSDATVQVRSRVDGEWQEWLPLHRDREEHLPDPDSRELAEIDQDVSEPIWIGGASEVQFRSDQELDLDVSWIDTSGGEGIAWQPDETSAQSLADLSTTSSASASVPKVLTRADWGADESLRTDKVDYSSSGTVRFSVLHHVGGGHWSSGEISNGCTRADDWIRSIYEYHTQVRGYWDIAYNFVVDPCGRIWEGRWGGIDKPVTGAHAGGFNDGSVGVLALGSFDGSSADPVTSALKTGINEIMGYKLGSDNVDPGTSIKEVSGGGSARWPSGTEVQVPTLSAHQVTNFTSCPGDKLFGALFTGSGASGLPRDAYVSAVEKVIDDNGYGDPEPDPTIKGDPSIGDLNGDGQKDVLFYDEASGQVVVRALRLDGRIGTVRSTYRVASGWSDVFLADVNGDREDELVFHRSANGQVAVYDTTHSGKLGSRLSAYTVSNGWSAVSRFAVGSSGADRLGFYKESTGSLSTYSLWRSGKLRSRIAIASVGAGWSTVQGGDFNRDGQAELIAYRSATGVLEVRSLGNTGEAGTLRWKTSVAKGWGTVMAGDMDADGRAELLFHRPSDQWVLVYDTTISGSLGKTLVSTSLASGWDVLANANFTRSFGDQMLFYRASTGSLAVYSRTGTGALDSRLSAYRVAAGWTHLVPGDLDGDGRDELMFYNASNRRLLAYRMTDTGRFDGLVAATTLGGTWDNLFAGDFDGDGRDEVGFHRRSGTVAMYRASLSNVVGRFLTSYSVAGWDRISAGDIEGDRAAELVFHRDRGSAVAYATKDNGWLDYVVWSVGLSTPYTTLVLGDPGGDGDEQLTAYARSSGDTRVWDGLFNVKSMSLMASYQAR